MSDVVIRVRGEHERQVPAERGTALVVVEAQGPEAAPVRIAVSIPPCRAPDGKPVSGSSTTTNALMVGSGGVRVKFSGKIETILVASWWLPARYPGM